MLLLVRGGGSIEDLWAFNDERVARAVRACPIPVVSGVGHETDVTIADFAADRRAPTPTAAAELASPPREALLARVGEAAGRLSRRFRRDLDTRAQLLDHLSRRLVHPGRRLEAQVAARRAARRAPRTRARGGLERRAHRVAQADARLRAGAAAASMRSRRRVERAAQRGRHALARRLEQSEARLARLAQSLAHLDPRAVLGRGYAIVADASGAIVRDAAALAPGAPIDITLAQGGASATVERVRDAKP